jgi:hypothetical protein
MHTSLKRAENFNINLKLFETEENKNRLKHERNDILKIDDASP